MGAIPQIIIDACNDILTKLEGRFENYLKSLRSGKFPKLYEYILRADQPSPLNFSGIARIATKTGEWYDVPFKRSLIGETTLYLQGFPFDKVNIKIVFPEKLFGENNVLPMVEYSIEAPVAYPGYFGLVWEPLIGSPEMPKFHPYTDPAKMEQELVQYYNEGIVDLFCDILNRGDYPQCDTLLLVRKNIKEGALSKYFKYKNKATNDPNYIRIPIIGEYFPDENKHIIKVISWAVGKSENWISPETVLFDILYPISAIISMFDEDAEFIEGAEPAPLKEVKRDLREISKKEKLKDRQFDPFLRQEKRVIRDEFGFIIGEEDGVDSFGSRDITAGRKSLWEIQKQMEEKKRKEMEMAQKMVNRNIIHYSSPEEFYRDNETRRFTVKGAYSHLGFVERSKIELVKSCNPPFILRFARDKIKVKKRVTNKEAIKILFDVYKMGYLVPI